MSVDMKYASGYTHSRQISYELGDASVKTHELETRVVPVELAGSMPMPVVQEHETNVEEDRY